MKNNTNMLSHLQGKPRMERSWVNRLTIEPQTFCGLKEIELKNRKINQQCVTITQSRLANKKKTAACHAYQINRLG